MVEDLKVMAPGKLNLYLDIIGKRPDGYHDLKMIMQSINLCDEVNITITHDRNIEIISSDKDVPTDENNIAYKAVQIFYSTCMQKFSGVKITIKKQIPVEAGMGGGSADAAAVLVGLNVIEGNPVSDIKLMELAEKIGADVPFAIKGGTCIVNGTGDIITPIKPLENIYFVIVKPAGGISTAAAYKEIDNKKVFLKDKFKEMTEAVESGNVNEMKKYMQNAFEVVCSAPEVEWSKQELLAEGAEVSMMTGSGSAVFGIFSDLKKAETAQKNLQKKFAKVYLAEPISEGSYFVL